MAQLQKVEGEVEVKCTAEKLFEMFAGKKQDIANICSEKVPTIEAPQGDWITVGTTRNWTFVIDGKSQEVLERLEAVDEENKTMRVAIIDGEIMKTYYKTMSSILQVNPKGGDCCVVKLTLEYQKFAEDAPEPYALLNFSLGVITDVGHAINHANNNA